MALPVKNKPVVAFRVGLKQPHLLHIESQIENALKPFPEYLKQIKQYAKSIHPYFDGCSSYRVLQAVEDFITQVWSS